MHHMQREQSKKAEFLDKSIWIQHLFRYSHFFISKAEDTQKTSISDSNMQWVELQHRTSITLAV